jgi:hypothetical protein
MQATFSRIAECTHTAYHAVLRLRSGASANEREHDYRTLRTACRSLDALVPPTRQPPGSWHDGLGMLLACASHVLCAVYPREADTH